jgi:hypothetical protein
MRVVLLLLLIAASQACVFEIRSAVFYPNGTQEISRDWLIVDFENSYGYDLFDVEFGDIAHVPVIKKGERVRIDPYRIVTPQNFPITISASTRVFADRSEIEYSVTNLGNSTEIEISFPAFSDLISCENCEISNGSIIFRKILEKNETANFRLITNRAFSVPDATIGFSYDEPFSLNFTANIPVSVVKGRSDKWMGFFNVTNTIDREIEVRAAAFADFQNGSRTELFKETFVLKKGENFSRYVEIESEEVPIFIFKISARVSDFCRLKILPAYEAEGRFIIGQALLKGFSYHPAFPLPAALPAGLPPSVETPVLPTPPTTIPTPATTAKREERISLEFRIPFERVPRELVIPYFVAMFPSLFGLFFVTVFFPIRSRRGVVATRDQEEAARIFSPRFRVYCPPSSPISFGIVVEPDEDIVSALMENGIPRNYAEAIAVAAKVKKPLIVEREDVARIALKLGIPVILYGKHR